MIFTFHVFILGGGGDIPPLITILMWISILYFNLILPIFSVTEPSYYVAIGMPVLVMGHAQIILCVTVMFVASMMMIICQMYRYRGVHWITFVIDMVLNCLICVKRLHCALLTVDWAVTIKLVHTHTHVTLAVVLLTIYSSTNT